jgi:hypothetical protein
MRDIIKDIQEVEKGFQPSKEHLIVITSNDNTHLIDYLSGSLLLDYSFKPLCYQRT